MSSRPRRSYSIAGHPVLIGAVTTLLVVVGVFLAYNANHGLPFAPAYRVKVELPNAASLVVGNDVRIAGTRVGTIEGMTAYQDSRTGAVGARLALKLDKRVAPLPTDTTAIVRSRSALGLKYLQLTPGRARRGVAAGATLPLANARPEPVELDQVLNTFDARTRAASQQNLVTFGDALAGRGGDLNQTIAALAPLLLHLEPVSRYLAAPSTGLVALLRSADRAANEVAPVADTQGRLLRDLDTTFAALAGVSQPFLGQAIEGAPPALEQATRSFVADRPFLAKATEFMRLLRPGAAALRAAAPSLGGALTAGATNLRRATRLNRRLGASLTALGSFAADPLVELGLRDLAGTARAGAPVLGDLNGAQTVCNYVTLFFRNVASLLSEGDSVGAWSRFVIVLSPLGPNNEGAPASGPAAGPGIDNHLHTNPYPNVGAPGQAHECEAGNESYLPGRTVVGNVPAVVGTAHDQTTRDAGARSRSGTNATAARRGGR